jgi:hypothetical protein
MYWYNGGSWRLTDDLSIWNGSVWKQVVECWIWDGSAWRSTHVGPTTLSSVNVIDAACDPLLGTYRVSWSYASPNIGDWFLRIEARFNGGSYTIAADNIDPTTSPYTDSVDGFAGFTSLDTTDFRISLLAVSDGATNAGGSPQTRNGPFSC